MYKARTWQPTRITYITYIHAPAHSTHTLLCTLSSSSVDKPDRFSADNNGALLKAIWWGREKQGCPLVCATKECCKFNWTTPKWKNKIKSSFQQQRQRQQQVSLELRHRQRRRRRRAALERRQITVSKAKQQRPKQWIENGRSSAAGSGNYKRQKQRERVANADRSKESKWCNAQVCSTAKFKWAGNILSGFKYPAVTAILVTDLMRDRFNDII